MFVVALLIGGIGVALIMRYRQTAAMAAPAGGSDAPARLLGWATGLLDADRAEWGQAMLGELDRLEGRAPRWRFALADALRHGPAALRAHGTVVRGVDQGHAIPLAGLAAPC